MKALTPFLDDRNVNMITVAHFVSTPKIKHKKERIIYTGLAATDQDRRIERGQTRHIL